MEEKIKEMLEKNFGYKVSTIEKMVGFEDYNYRVTFVATSSDSDTEFGQFVEHIVFKVTYAKERHLGRYFLSRHFFEDKAVMASKQNKNNSTASNVYIMCHK